MTKDVPDEQLLAAFLAGRRQALGELAERYERALLGLASGLLGGRRDLACDAVQETWMRVIRFGGQFGGRSSFKTWLYRITINQCHALLAAQAAGRDASDGPGTSKADQPAEDGAMKIEQDQRVRRAVQSLDPARREVVLLCYHAGMTHAEAAQVLEVPIGTLKSRLHAALEALRQALSEEVRP